MAASQNGFNSYKAPIHKKTNIMQLMTKNIKFYLSQFYHREIVKLDHFMTLSLSYANTVLWCSRCKIHRFVAAPSVVSRARIFKLFKESKNRFQGTNSAGRYDNPFPTWLLAPIYCLKLPAQGRGKEGLRQRVSERSRGYVVFVLLIQINKCESIL